MGSSSSFPEVEPSEDGFQVRHVGHAFINGICHYDFFVQPPPVAAAPGQTVRRSFNDLAKLAAVMGQRHSRVPAVPKQPMFDTGAEGKDIERYLRSLLVLEPWPRSNALRQFLGIAMPPPAPSYCAPAETVPPAVVLGQRVPLGALAILLSFCRASDAVGVYSRVCKSFQAAALHASAWPRLRISSGVAEHVIDSLCFILMSTFTGLQDLSLDLTFQQADLGIALPADLVLRQLQRLELKLGDPEAISFACDLLSCVESPKLRDVKVVAALTPQLLHALRMALLPTQGLNSLSLVAVPDKGLEATLSADTVAALQQILEATPVISNLMISLEDCTGGLSRSLQPDAFGSHHFLRSCMALGNLTKVAFDFLSDDLVAFLLQIDDRSWRLQSARFSGCKRSLQDPDQTLVTLLGKLSNDLEEFAFLVDLELPVRSFAQGIWGILHQRLGALPNLWQHRGALRMLELNWQAFDEEGIASLVECCPQLEVLLLDRAEYWTDATVQRILSSLPSLSQLRVRSSSMISDQTLFELQQAPPGLRILELEPSYAMSTCMMDQLKASLCPNDFRFSSITSFMAAELLGLQAPSRSSAVQLTMLKPLDEETPSMTLWPQLTLGRSRKLPREGMYIGR